MTLEVVHQHEKLAPESGVEFRPMALISGAGFWSMCQRPNSAQLAAKGCNLPVASLMPHLLHHHNTHIGRIPLYNNDEAGTIYLQSGRKEQQYYMHITTGSDHRSEKQRSDINANSVSNELRLWVGVFTDKSQCYPFEIHLIVNILTSFLWY